MEKYDVLNQIGDGTFGSVAKAVSKKTGQLVAIKKMKQKFYTWDECVKLPEVDVVRRIHGHPNIVKLREVIRENNELFFVFEYMDGDLLGAIKKAKQLQRPEDAAQAPALAYPTVKSYMQQILQALAYVHKRGYFHRDMKPENLLVRREESTEEVVKLADFGLVKEIRARPPFTDYVSTRWYRAPELLLQDRSYGAPVDIWAAGCIMSELITTKPLFPGSNEVDQLFKVMSVMGSPTERTWPGGIQLGRKIRYSFPSIKGSGLAAAAPKHIPAQALDLISTMLTYDPKARPTAEQCLQHPFFSVGIDENNGPSVAAMEQLAMASKRLQQHQMLTTSPQSAPAALGGGGAPGSLGELKSKRPSDASVAQSPYSAQKYYMLGGGPAGAPLGPKVAFAAPKVGVYGDRTAGSGATSPPRSPPAAEKVSPAGSSSAVSPAPQPKVTGGIRGLHLANLRSGAVKNFAKPGSTSAGTALQDVKKSVPESGYGAASKPPPLSKFKGGGGASSDTDTATNLASSVGLGRRRPSGPQPPPPPSDAGTAKPLQGKGDVDLDSLMAEFASEMSTMGLNAQRRSSSPRTGGGGGAGAQSKIDPVAALLNNSRYKSSSPAVAAPRSGLPSGSEAPANPGPRYSLQRGSVLDRKGSDGRKASGDASPASGASHTVSPSIKALLAKRRKGAYAVANK